MPSNAFLCDVAALKGTASSLRLAPFLNKTIYVKWLALPGAANQVVKFQINSIIKMFK